MPEKTLVVVSTHNAPAFLEVLMATIEHYDAGAPFDLLVVDSKSNDSEQLKLLNEIAKHHMVETRENVGRAQGAYQYAWDNYPEYSHYFFMHDDSCVLRDGWLLRGLNRLQDQSLEPCLPDKYRAVPVGKVGYSSYEWGTIDRYLRTGHPAIFRFMQPLAEQMNLVIPELFQHIADDRTLYSQACLKAMNGIANLENFRWENGTPILPMVHEFFAKNFPGRGFIEPMARYNSWEWEGYQTLCEFLNDVAPMRYGFRTHNVEGDGYSQEELGYNTFWGNEWVAHFGSHNVFKRLALILETSEYTIRESYKSLNHLWFYATIIKDNGKAIRASRHRYAQQPRAN